MRRISIAGALTVMLVPSAAIVAATVPTGIAAAMADIVMTRGRRSASAGDARS